MINIIYDKFKECSGVSIDTRTIKKGEMFFAIKGERFDANEYIHIAKESGAKYIVTDQLTTKEKYEDALLVDDVIKTLQNLAMYHRDQFDIPFIGITGSNGKTTTKELINAVLSKKYNTHYTKGNLNNHLGVPLTLLAVKEDCEIAIIEMGANHVGEIAFLSSLAKPTHGVITNIGKAHLEGFGSLEGVVKGKTELYQNLDQSKGYVFYNVNSNILPSKLPANTKNIQYGDSITIKSSFPILEFNYDKQEFSSHLIGTYNAINISCAVEIGKFFGIEIEKIKEAVAEYNPDMNRSQVIQKQNFTLIADAYNANPISMSAAISNFKEIQHDNKILILGDMLELGQDAKIEHQKIADSIADSAMRVFFVGDNFMKVTTSYAQFNNTSELKENNLLSAELLEGSLVLIKGSRGIALEKLFKDIK